MASAFEGGGQEDIHDLQRGRQVHHPLAERENVGVIVPPGQACRFRIPAQPAAHAADAVGRHGLAIAGAAEDDAPLVLARRHGFSVIQNLNGHGTGRNLWETPSVPGYEDPRDRTRLWEGLVLAIEPFLSTGATWADEAADGWTLVTPGHLTAQFEHTVVVTNGAPLVLTA